MNELQIIYNLNTLKIKQAVKTMYRKIRSKICYIVGFTVYVYVLLRYYEWFECVLNFTFFIEVGSVKDCTMRKVSYSVN